MGVHHTGGTLHTAKYGVSVAATHRAGLALRPFLGLDEKELVRFVLRHHNLLLLIS